MDTLLTVINIAAAMEDSFTSSMPRGAEYLIKAPAPVLVS